MNRDSVGSGGAVSREKQELEKKQELTEARDLGKCPAGCVELLLAGRSGPAGKQASRQSQPANKPANQAT
ncbi:hypothetical protein A0K93_00820 [Corynebacterium sp. BCW_4722]|nr:hypothetical protein A0K93_00820 [Corynebacterium sp. BCW_4722]